MISVYQATRETKNDGGTTSTDGSTRVIKITMLSFERLNLGKNGKASGPTPIQKIGESEQMSEQ